MKPLHRKPLAAIVLALLLPVLVACPFVPRRAEEPAFPTPPLRPDDERVISRKAFIDERDDWTPLGGVKSWKLEGRSAEFELDDGARAMLWFASGDAFRFRFDPSGRYPADASRAVADRELGEAVVTASETAEGIAFSPGGITVVVAKAALGISVYRHGALVSGDVEPVRVSGNRVAAFKDLAPGDRIFGLGEKSGLLLKNGQSVTMWNTDAYGYVGASDPLYMSVPFFLNAGERGTWGILFDNTRQTFFDIGREEPGLLRFGAAGGEMDYWFMAGDDVAGVLRSYASLTGKARLPPEWALGYQQSRYSYMSAKEALAVASSMRERRIPADVLYFDIDFMDGYRDFTWNPIAFPDPAGMLDELHGMGFKAITIIDPGIKEEAGYAPYDTGIAEGVFLRDREGEFVRAKVWPGVCLFPDFSSPAARSWWGRLYGPLLDLGFDGIWNDMNEPAAFDAPYGTITMRAVHADGGKSSPHAAMHNVYGHEMVRATAEGLDLQRPDSRNFVLSRSGFAGSQRYAAFWTGDNSATWEHLGLNVSMVLGLGLSGFPFAGADVGGYKGNPSPELFARWMQAAALLPLFRNHTEKGASPHEPWAFGPEAEAVARAAVELRYSLLQYIYDLARNACETGEPLVRPLFYGFPGDAPSYGTADEFLLGDGLLCAPVLRQGSRERDVYLPAGCVWYDWYDGTPYEGGRTHRVAAPLGKLPLYARSGAVVPVREVEQYVGEKAGPRVELAVWPGSSGSYSMYQDDGVSKAYLEGRYLITEFSFEEKGGTLSASLRALPGKGGFRPRNRGLWLRFVRRDPAAGLLVNGTVPSWRSGEAPATGKDPGAWVDGEDVLVFVPEGGPP